MKQLVYLFPIRPMAHMTCMFDCFSINDSQLSKMKKSRFFTCPYHKMVLLPSRPYQTVTKWWTLCTCICCLNGSCFYIFLIFLLDSLPTKESRFTNRLIVSEIFLSFSSLLYLRVMRHSVKAYIDKYCSISQSEYNQLGQKVYTFTYISNEKVLNYRVNVKLGCYLRVSSHEILVYIVCQYFFHTNTRVTCVHIFSLLF